VPEKAAAITPEPLASPLGLERLDGFIADPSEFFGFSL